MVISRGIHWADLPEPYGRRPVCILTRDAAIGVLRRVTVAPISRTMRGIASEVIIGAEEGLATESVITCDNIMTIPQVVVDPEPVGMLSPAQQRALDQALRYALAMR
jgi:mRNA interferase MazF